MMEHGGRLYSTRAKTLEVTEEWFLFQLSIFFFPLLSSPPFRLDLYPPDFTTRTRFQINRLQSVMKDRAGYEGWGGVGGEGSEFP